MNSDDLMTRRPSEKNGREASAEIGRYIKRRGRAARGALAALALLTAAFDASGCSDAEGSGNPEKRMYLSDGEFSQGYKDGKGDAEASWTDMNAGWMWLWMTGQEYQKGYNQGWNDGRQVKKLRPSKTPSSASTNAKK